MVLLAVGRRRSVEPAGAHGVNPAAVASSRGIATHQDAFTSRYRHQFAGDEPGELIVNFCSKLSLRSFNLSAELCGIIAFPILSRPGSLRLADMAYRSAARRAFLRSRCIWRPILSARASVSLRQSRDRTCTCRIPGFWLFCHLYAEKKCDKL